MQSCGNIIREAVSAMLAVLKATASLLFLLQQQCCEGHTSTHFGHFEVLRSNQNSIMCRKVKPLV